GSSKLDSKYTKPFHDLKPIIISLKPGIYQNLSRWTGIALKSPSCQDFGFNNLRFFVYTKSDNQLRRRWLMASSHTN
ncbi:hypothetical protein T440DRAFT_409666, partial [Plenodomus tracheiphilus IPT5]